MDDLNRKDNENALQAMKGMKIEFVRPEKQEIEHWNRLAIEVINEFGPKAASPELYEKMKKLLADFRAKQASSTSR